MELWENLLAVLLLGALTTAQKLGETCLDHGKAEGECKKASECDYVKMTLLIIPVVYCEETGVVCCRKRFRPPTKPPPKLQTISEMKCEEYAKQRSIPCPTPYIVGGTQVRSKEFPHVVLLGYKNDTYLEPKCGGVLISPNFVLTVAHCLRGDINFARLGEIDVNSSSDNTEFQDFDIIDNFENPHFNDNKYHDIGLMKLDRDAQLNDFVFPACLPSSDATIGKNDSFIVAGWGYNSYASLKRSSRLMQTELDFYDEDKCHQLQLHAGFPSSDDRIQFCAIGRNGSDSCQGDSGGPLFKEHPHYKCMYTVFGLVSEGITGCGSDYPNVNTKVQLYNSWIEKIVWPYLQL